VEIRIVKHSRRPYDAVEVLRLNVPMRERKALQSIDERCTAMVHKVRIQSVKRQGAFKEKKQ
jgi:hypothetical protein